LLNFALLLQKLARGRAARRLCAALRQAYAEVEGMGMGMAEEEVGLMSLAHAHIVGGLGSEVEGETALLPPPPPPPSAHLHARLCALLRGYAVRWRWCKAADMPAPQRLTRSGPYTLTLAKRVCLARARLAAAARDASSGRTTPLGQRLYAALHKLAGARGLREAFDAVATAELASRLSPPCAHALLRTRAHHTLLAILRACTGGRLRDAAHVTLARKVLLCYRNMLDAGGAGGAGGEAQRAVARALCTSEALRALLDTLELWQCNLAVVRPALYVLKGLLACSASARAGIAGDGSFMSRLTTLRNLHRGRLGKLRPVAAGGAGGAEERAQAQRARLLAVGMEAGSEGFSLESTCREWEELLGSLREAAAAHKARA